MATRILENALITTATGALKSNCAGCRQRHMCQRISQVIDELRLEKIHVWDIEHQMRFRSLLKELGILGFNFPDGFAICDIISMSRPEIMTLLREAQILLIEVKSER